MSTEPTQTATQTIEIPGLSGRYVPITKRYFYDLDKCRCPNCGGLGMPWAGWFSCDDCPCVAVVDDGRAFIPEGSVIRG